MQHTLRSPEEVEELRKRNAELVQTNQKVTKENTALRVSMLEVLLPLLPLKHVVLSGLVLSRLCACSPYSLLIFSLYHQGEDEGQAGR
jgi:hypothetical protein